MAVRKMTLPLVGLLCCLPVPAQEISPDSVLVQMPWNRAVRRAVATGSSASVSGAEMDRVPAVDIRGFLTGCWPSLDVTENTGDFRAYLGSSTSLSADNAGFTLSNRHLTGLVCIVDDVPVPIGNLMLDPSQIESITLLNDLADKAKYGPLASGGALCIRTRRGRYDTPSRIDVHVEGGVGVVDRMPEWVNGFDYASLNNLARINAGYVPRFDNVDAFRELRPVDHVYPNVDYRDLMVRNTKTVLKAGLSLSGGNANINYYVGIGAAHEDGLFKIGPTVDYSKINFISRVSARIGLWLEVSAGVVGNVAMGNDNFASMTSFKDVPAVEYPAILGYFTPSADTDLDVKEGTPVYALTRTNANNPYATLMEGGFTNTRHRSGMFNASVDWDLGWLLKGLRSRTFVDINLLNAITVGKKNDFLAYYWTPAGGIGDVTSHKGEKVAAKSLRTRSAYQEWLLYENLSYTLSKGGHNLYADATYYLSDARNTQNNYYERQQNAIGTLSYSYGDRYSIEAVLDYAGNARLPKANRYRLFPSGGIAWTVSNEPFLRRAAWLDFFQLRAQAGLLGTSDLFSAPYLYESSYSYQTGEMTFGPATYGRWFGENTAASGASTLDRIHNPGLQWEVRREADLGVEATLLGRLSLGFNYFWHIRDGVLGNVQAKEPGVTGLSGMTIYDNGITIRYRGWEASLGWKDRIGAFRYGIRLWASRYESEYLRLDTDFFAYNYQSMVGRSLTSIWGYRTDGKFTSAAEIAASPLLTAATYVGDLKYIDQNFDDAINSNDSRMIGDSEPSLRYGLVLDLGYGPVELHVVGTGRSGFDLPLTNAYFWNGWGDGNYSAFVRDHIGGDYPRLSYVKSGNNFVMSDFWLRDGSFFKIQSLELSYRAPERWNRNLGIAGLTFFLRGANLLTLTRIPYIDPEAPDSGVSTVPLYRTFTGGLKIQFQ